MYATMQAHTRTCGHRHSSSCERASFRTVRTSGTDVTHLLETSLSISSMNTMPFCSASVTASRRKSSVASFFSSSASSSAEDCDIDTGGGFEVCQIVRVRPSPSISAMTIGNNAINPPHTFPRLPHGERLLVGGHLAAATAAR